MKYLLIESFMVQATICENWILERKNKSIVNDIDPREYLVYILTEMPKEKNLEDEETLRKYLPWNIPKDIKFE